MNKGFKILIPAITVLVLMIVFVWYLDNDPTAQFAAGNPGNDRDLAAGTMIKQEIINIGEYFKSFTNTEDAGFKSESWPRFRGENFDNISRTTVALIDSFPPQGPPVLWSHELGEGHAGAAIYQGLVYVMDYDEESNSDILHCYDLKSGQEQWQRGYKVKVKRNHGMSRTVPAITDDYILTIGPRCHVMCLDRKTGDFRWGIDIEKEYQSEVPLWYTGQCPYIDDDQAIIATGGTTLLIGVDCKSGKVLWQTPNEKGWKMSHSSVLPYTLNGKKMYVYAAVGGIVGIEATGRNKGAILWEETAWNHSVVAPSPVCMPDGKIFLSAGYGAGAMMLQLKKENNIYTTSVLEEYKPNQGLASEQQTVLYFQQHLLGIAPKDAGAYRNQLICVDPANPKNILWSSGKETRFGLGPYMIADGKIFLLNDDGTLVIIKASTTRYEELSRYQLIDGHDAWAPLALANGLMVLRDSKTMICVDLNRNNHE